ncbi:MAG: hypothetical protein OXK79_05570 [Chloroflexota bacterium]|nr:hypothetical protein [Chloroflexota bacterium]
MIKIPHLDDDPYLPAVGEVYWVNCTIITPADSKPDRPVLVVSVPADALGRITVVTRTSNTQRRPGVASAVDDALGLNKPGVWGYVRTAEAALWTPTMVTYRGVIEVEVLQQVREEFGL